MILLNPELNFAAETNHDVSVCKLTDCSFCRLARGGQDEFTERTGHSPILNNGVGRSELMVMMDSFPIGEHGGHVLIVPRRHMASLAQFQNQDMLQATLQETAELIQRLFPDHWLFTFEHGPGELAGNRVKCGGCHVDHAHGHILVLPRSISFEEIQEQVEDVLENLEWDLATQTDFPEQPMVGIAEFVQDKPYLQIGRWGDVTEAITYRQESGNQSIPSQLLRRIVSTVAGKSAPIHWNWKIALQQNLTERLDQYEQEALEFLNRFNSLADQVAATEGVADVAV